jgi:hypothetical protein
LADASHLPPEVLYALRTGKLPAHLLESNPEVAVESDESSEQDAERFRRRYHAMVEERIADWLDENPGYGKSIPDHERARIEAYCDRQIQHQWRIFVSTRDEPAHQEDGEGRGSW